MLRFIVNFFLFGFIFYMIHLFFPEAFATLVSWAGGAFTWVKGIYHSLVSTAAS